MKTEIYNLIILDESGSMSCVHRQTISGCNETLNTIRVAQKHHVEEQQHFVSIYVFQSEGSRPSRYLLKNVPIDEVKDISAEDYEPEGMTPLNDAVGATLIDLKATTKFSELAVGSITIITDGMENSSREFSTEKVRNLISELKAKGWNFNFIGANIDVERTASDYNIDNSMSFCQDEEGTSMMFKKQNKSRERYYEKLACCFGKDSLAERIKKLSAASADFFGNNESDRVTAERVSKLKENEIFVFGSNLDGSHGGGAALVAYKRFGAIWGQGVGIQGQSYGIPTMHGGVEEIRPYVDEFIDFAKANPNLKFLVTRIGCGIAGFTDDEIAPLFINAKDVGNIYLPKKFWKVLKK